MGGAQSSGKRRWSRSRSYEANAADLAQKLSQEQFPQAHGARAERAHHGGAGDDDLFVSIVDQLEELDEQVSNSSSAGAPWAQQEHLEGGDSSGEGGSSADGLPKWLRMLTSHRPHHTHHRPRSPRAGGGARRQDGDSGSEAGSAAPESEGESDEDADESGWRSAAPLAAWELEATFQRLRRQELPDQGVAARLIAGVARLYSAQRSLVHIGRPAAGEKLVVVGDLHGHFGDLMHILDEHGLPRRGPGGTLYLFNGDFVDRGEWGPEVLLCLYCMKLRTPEAVHLNRGNHEDMAQNKIQANGFRDAHCPRAWPAPHTDRMYRLCRQSFKQLPLCHVVGGEVAVIHGGLPVDANITLEDIAAVNRRHRTPVASTIILGYPEGQRVRAQRTLVVGRAAVVPAGTPGVLIGKIPKSTRAIVRFQGLKRPVPVWMAGAPELEDEVEICYDSEWQRRQNRSDRIFAAMLWSDPIASSPSSAEPEEGADSLGPCFLRALGLCPARRKGGRQRAGPNTARNIGSLFDRDITQAFLRANGLRCLVRSHQKTPEGVREDQTADDGSLIAATVFSASNYPCGAGQPSGNKAGVFVMTPATSSSNSSAGLEKVEPWREHYLHGKDVRRQWSQQASMRLHTGSPEVPGSPETPTQQRSGTAREHALEQLWLLVYCARPDLLAHFNRVDAKETGMVHLTDWASAMRSCVVASAEFPWERVAPYLASFDHRGWCRYAAFLARYKNGLASRLEAHWCDRVLKELFQEMSSDLSSAWDKLDVDETGQLSYTELRPLLMKAPTCAELSRDVVNDMAYAVLATLDRDSSGFVERDEFLHAAEKAAAAAEADAGAKGLSKRLTKRLDTVTHIAVGKTWAGLQGVLRVLSVMPSRAMQIFSCFDSNGDGLLHRNEFQEGLLRLLRGSGLDRSMEQWEPVLWRLMDANDDGSISPSELMLALRVQDTAQSASNGEQDSDASSSDLSSELEESDSDGAGCGIALCRAAG